MFLYSKGAEADESRFGTSFHPATKVLRSVSLAREMVAKTNLRHSEPGQKWPYPTAARRRSPMKLGDWGLSLCVEVELGPCKIDGRVPAPQEAHIGPRSPRLL